MATQITLPRLGQGMESGVIVRWLKAEGDAVIKGEPLYELDTEKVTQEVEADADGVLLKILHHEGADVPVGETIAMIGAEGEALPEGAAPSAPAAAASSEPAPPASEPASAPAVSAAVATAATAAPAVAATTAAPAGGRVKASPLAKRMAKDRGIDLAAVQGTGPEGRIVAEDVERAAAGEAPGVTPAFSVPSVAPEAEAPAVQTVEFTAMRRTIARRMSEAWQAPHFQVSLTADVGRMIDLRKRLVDATPEGGVRPTYSDVITRLVAAGLTRHPALNAHFAGDAVHQYTPANIGIAIAVDGGLVVPVIPACERRAVTAIAAARADLVERSRAGKLRAEDFEGGTFTISNLGMYGIERFMAVINPPQVAILAVGSIEERVVVDDGEMVVRPRMEMTLSCDHRAVDGAQGAEFLRTVKQLVEEPGLAL
jgi:pyruvate dehydrogenase E2 component (dihydrolipoamide acetyltransferase)